MKFGTRFTFITFLTSVKFNQNFQNLTPLPNHSDSIENFINEEDYKNLPPELQLEKLDEDKKLYNNVQRLIRKSKEYELPKNDITFQSVYPPTDNTTANTVDSDNNTEDVVTQLFESEYEPVRPEYKSKSTLELIPAIVQKPVIPLENRDEIEVGKLFSVGDYSKGEERHENEFYLPQINQRLKHKIRVDNDDTVNTVDNDNTVDKVDNSNSVESVDSVELSRWERYERLNRNKKFVKELRKLKLEKAMKYRKFLRHLRQLKEKKKNTFYRSLPTNTKGYKIFNSDDIEKFEYEELQEELRNRGYRCSYDKQTLVETLRYVNENEEGWRYERIVKQQLTPENTNLSQITRNKLKDIYEMIEVLNGTQESDDISVRIKRLEIIFDLIQFYTDPVGYLDLDLYEEEVDKQELEEIKKAPVIYDTDFFNEMSKPIIKLPDLIPRTFNLQDDYVKKFPITSVTSPNELDALKREYLTIEGGIHQQTLPEISERFNVSIDFLGDACCRLGAYVPIDMTRELRGIISYSAIWDLLQFLNICDPTEIELFYTNLSLHQIANELNISMKLLRKFLEKLGVKLPFGDETRLNITCLKYLELFTKHYKMKYKPTDIEDNVENEVKD